MHIFRKLTSGGYQDLGAVGININGTAASEFYADGLDPGDWNDDGKVDLSGVGVSSIAGTDAGIALWTSNLATTNRWLKVRTPDVSGFFTGAAKIEIFDAGAAGDVAQYVTPPLVLRTGRAWATQVHHFGVGTRATVDVRVTFPDGRQSIQSEVATNTTIVVEPIANLPPVASAIANPTTAIVGQAIAFDGSGSSDADGLIANFAWSFGDGATGSGALASHTYAAAGTFLATLTVRDDRGRTATAQVSVSISDPEAPTAPSNLTATVVSSSRIDLAWSAATDNVGVTGYLVERCQDAGCASFSQIAATTTGTSFVDSGLAAGTSYSYRVRAIDAATNQGDVSNTASATTFAPDLEAPGAPSNLTASAASSSQIDLAWAGAADNVGVTVYAIERCQGVGCAGFAQIATSSGTTFSNTGLAASTPYSYRVRAQDAASNLGPYSGTAGATTYITPANPTFVQGKFSCPQSPQTVVPVSFTSAQTGGDLNVVLVGWSDSTAQITSVTDSAGNSYALAVGPTVLSGSASHAIYYARNILAAGAGNVVTVRFATAAAYPDVRILQYRGLDRVSPLDVVSAGTGTGTSSSVPAVATTSTVDLLVAGNYVQTSTTGAGSGFTSRFVTSPDGDIAEDRVVTAAGSYGASAPLSAAGWWVMQMVAFKAASGPPDTQAPTVPSNLTATVVSGSQINLAWTAATDNVGVTGYLVERCQGAGCATFAQVATTTGVTFNNTGLGAGTSYSYRVRATDAANNASGVSGVATATTTAPDTQAPSDPSNLTATVVSGSQINLAWTAATDNVGVTGYLVERCQGAGCASFAQVATTTGVTFNNTGLGAGTSYSYRVRATDAANNTSGVSGVATATTTPAPDTQAPTIPSNLTATVVSGSQINLAWTAATDNVGVTGYLVERCQGAGCANFAQIATTTGATSFNNTGLGAGTSYSYRVRATDAANNTSGVSGVSTATTTAPAPDTQAPSDPSNLTATAVSGSQINLAWTAATDNVGVTGYLVERCQGAGCATFAQVATVTAASFNNTGLASATSYSFRVRAQDAAGNLGAYCSGASATTQAAPPANPTFVQRSSAVPKSSQTTVNVTYASAQTAGDLNVVIVGWDGTTAQIASITDAAGNVYTRAVGPTAVAGVASQSIYYAKDIVGAGAGNVVTVKFAPAAPYPDVRILQYRGVDPVNPVDVVAAGSGTSTSSSTPAVTTTNAVDLLVAGNFVQTRTSGAGSNFTSRVITSPNGNIAEDRVVTTAGPYAATAPLAGSGWWIMQMVAFRAK